VSREHLKVGIIAAEHSGDRLGSKLILALQETSELKIYGLGGPSVSSLGIDTPDGMHYQDLQVMGLVDPLLKLPSLLQMRKKLLKLFIQEKIDVFIGVDSPDFNMYFHKHLSKKNIKTIQVVSPSVWAWRQKRIHAIKAYVDLTMCLFGFEHAFYQTKKINSLFLGHPFSELKQQESHSIKLKHHLDIKHDFISILPGSRKSEILQMTPIFFEAAKAILSDNPDAFFLIPAANLELANIIKSIKGIEDIPHMIALDAAQDFMSISPVSIATSGTVSLEAAVLGSAPIICYKTNTFNYAILSRMIKTPFIGLPNLLLQQPLFPELIQDQLSPESILSTYQTVSGNLESYQPFLKDIHKAITGIGFSAAAKAIRSLV